jgi:transposase InsO family protein
MRAILIEAKVNGAFESVNGACAALCLPRSTWYRHQGQAPVADLDIELRDQIQKIALSKTVYGYRRVTAELRRQGLVVNRKRVLRLLREDNLLCLRKRHFIATTDSDHGLPVYPNLVAGLLVERINQLWVSDITYIRLRGEFIYLAVILDACSRRVIGWELSRRIDTQLTLTALRMALRNRFGNRVQPGLIHHSDRGVQYAAIEYTDLLREAGIAISMSRKSNPYDNAQAESFMKTLKYEEVYLCEYANLQEATERIGHFLDQVYNRDRLHSRLGYVPPEEFETQLPGFNQPTIC